MRSMIAVMVVAVLLASGCARPATGDSNDDPSPPGDDNGSSDCSQDLTWTMREYTDDPCAHPLLPALESRCSQSGRWTIHPAFNEQGTICLVDSLDGSHRDLFVFADNVPADQYQEMLIREGWPVWTEAFWAGDESGVYLWYPDHLQKLWYVTVPDRTVHELASAQFFNNRDLTRMAVVLGSPAGTRNLVVMEQYVDWEQPDLRTYRLAVLDPDGHELTSIVEFDTDSWADAMATPEAVMLRRGPNEEAVINDTTLITSDVWLYLPSPDGWQDHHLGRLSSAGLRQASVTFVSVISARAHLVETAPGKSELPLFQLPQRVVDATISHITYRWCTDGNSVHFPMSGVMMESSR